MIVRLFKDDKNSLETELIEVRDIKELEEKLNGEYKKPEYLGAIVGEDNSQLTTGTFKPGYIYFHNGNTCSWFGYPVK